MPILWRYLIKNYLSLFALSLSAFIGMLLVVRFQEIATFACSGAGVKLVALFTFYQIPYILPFAIPISCLISSLILFRQLSQKKEITAFRAVGVSISHIKAPILYIAACLAFSNFIISSEIAPRCKSLSKDLIYSATTQNPLFAFQKNSPIKINNTNINVGTTKSDKSIENVSIVMKNNSENRLAIILAKKLQVSQNALLGKKVSVISYFDTENPNIPDHLVIENQERMDTQANNIAQVLQTADWKRNNECLNLRLLLTKLKLTDSKLLKKNIIIEIYKRLSLCLAPFVLTWLGASFGLYIGRHQNKKSILIVSAITALFLMSFLAGKSIKSSTLLSCALFFIPHVFVVLSALFHTSRINRGIE